MTDNYRILNALTNTQQSLFLGKVTAYIKCCVLP